MLTYAFIFIIFLDIFLLFRVMNMHANFHLVVVILTRPELVCFIGTDQL